ncbi:DUF364 domain-containing protein [Parathalassolituus penaei]|uniref:DUF364 domain-containing protein n=1 Tax=Parathalassolituus penaei TaxID=2997323 RepID=A0A9X3IT80_9GAMM|nr:DUF364 domain-containing protein [Parathalassolituus penaei]MCY0965634.1 DUF364 domain-containing protein [Parathalassolituus penaei]
MTAQDHPHPPSLLASAADWCGCYARIEQQALQIAADAVVERVTLGLNWSVVDIRQHDRLATGICFSPIDPPRNLPWPGSLCGRPVAELAGWLTHWDSTEAVVGTAVCNAAINLATPSLTSRISLDNNAPGHLRVFEHFAPQLAGKRVVVIGRYPGMERFSGRFDWDCIERKSSDQSLPDSAANFLIPSADWVFVTASSTANKTLPHLLMLCAQARRTHTQTLVLMGPSLPWMSDWAEWGVDYLAGVRVQDNGRLHSIAAEAGGTRIFEQAVGYELLKL